LGFLEKLREEFSFFRGNYLILIISWILMDFGRELPGTYYSDNETVNHNNYPIRRLG